MIIQYTETTIQQLNDNEVVFSNVGIVNPRTTQILMDYDEMVMLWIICRIFKKFHPDSDAYITADQHAMSIIPIPHSSRSILTSEKINQISRLDLEVRISLAVDMIGCYSIRSEIEHWELDESKIVYDVDDLINARSRHSMLLIRGSINLEEELYDCTSLGDIPRVYDNSIEYEELASRYGYIYRLNHDRDIILTAQQVDCLYVASQLLEQEELWYGLSSSGVIVAPSKISREYKSIPRYVVEEAAQLAHSVQVEKEDNRIITNYKIDDVGSVTYTSSMEIMREGDVDIFQAPILQVRQFSYQGSMLDKLHNRVLSIYPDAQVVTRTNTQLHIGPTIRINSYSRDVEALWNL